MNLLTKLTLCATITATAHAIEAVKGSTWYEKMNFGPAWSQTFEDNFAGQKRTAALKGLLIDLGEKKSSALFDTETLRWVTGYDGFVNWGGTPWTGAHGALTSLKNENPIFVTDSVAGWAADNGSFDDPRPLKGFGNLPTEHGSYIGYYKNEQKIIVKSIVHGAHILEMCSSDGPGKITKHLQIAARKKNLSNLLADEKGTWEINDKNAKSSDGLHVTINGEATLAAQNGRLTLQIPAGENTLAISVSYSRGSASTSTPPADLVSLTKGGKATHPDELTTSGTTGTPTEGSAWAVDQITIPTENPWNSNLRFGGFDFLDENTAVLSTWNGDVWTVSGIKSGGNFKWRRIATGLFETLGVKVVEGKIFVNGRDQITLLHDLNNDGEIDFFQAFNRDVIITKNFHEFAFDLQTDAQGNFYFVKASPVRGGGRGFDQITPHHGIVAKISPDGKKFEVIATGLRAPGGVGVGPQGQITTGENEGTWQPCCKMNYFTPDQAPVFLGTEDSRQELGKDKPFHEPLIYFPMAVDNSGGSQVWVPQGLNWGLKAGELMHLSYGQSSLYRILPENINGNMQGAAVRIPVNIQSSAMRARFHKDGSLFVLGFRGWQTNAASECAFQRIRYIADQPVLIPEKFTSDKESVTITFPVELDSELAEDPTSYTTERWKYIRCSQYGSGEFSIDNPNQQAEENAIKSESKNHIVHDKVEVLEAKLSPDKKSVRLKLKDMKPAQTLKIAYDLESTNGDVIQSTLHATIKNLK